MPFFQGNITKGTFVRRLNRFVVESRVGEKHIRAHLPNPGRLSELLLPGAALLLEEKSDRGKALPFGVIGVIREGTPIMLHTARTNDVAAHLIESEKIPGLKGFRIVSREVPVGRSRIDFLLRRGKTEMLLEVKSCTLFGGEVAMFPDAVTVRGKHHLEKLAQKAAEGTRAGVLFLVQWEKAKFFLPDYHTDIEFSEAFLKYKKKVEYYPVAVSWKEDLSLGDGAKSLSIPWRVLEAEMKDAGAYLLVFKILKRKNIEVGGLGGIEFPKGYYVYVGSAMKNLKSRLARHSRRRKKLKWHVDYFRQEAELLTALPIRTSLRIECAIAKTLKGISNGEIDKFGSSDCKCRSHLFFFGENPMDLSEFHKILQWYRMVLPVRTFA